MKLAEIEKTSIYYEIDDAIKVNYEANQFDCVAFIYAHFPNDNRTQIHKNAINWLKPGVSILLEAFQSKQIGKDSGGPKDIEMLYNEAKMLIDFQELEALKIETKTIVLNEGKFHSGEAEVIRVIGKKPL